MHYEHLLNSVREGVLQGFSKEGYAIDYEYIYLPTGEFDYMLIKKMAFMSLSIVASPANSLTFEKIKETKIQNSTKLITEAINPIEKTENDLETLLFETI